ncbi:helix-turn-helix transcriptional regulator [Deinococcus aetherius]|nr:WYL domain-containing protein [Deinococcus aetherius]
MTKGELCAQFEVGVRTIERDLQTLGQMGHAALPHPGHEKRLYIPKRGGAFNAPEALAAYTAIRLAYHHSPSGNRHYRHAMEQISRVLPESIRYTLNASVVDNGAAQVQERELEKVAQAWVDSRVLRFDYQPPSKPVERGNELCVYFIEISRTNLAPYVIGLERRKRGQVRTFKLSRMQHLEVLREGFEPDPAFDPKEFLSDAWGVVGSAAPITVTVRFTPDAAYRLLEGGYPNASFRTEPDGSIYAEFRAGADKTGLPRELLPFLLGWGPRAEVLAPAHVREYWLGELREALRRYDR